MLLGGQRHQRVINGAARDARRLCVSGSLRVRELLSTSGDGKRAFSSQRRRRVLVARRRAALTGPGEVLVSRTIRDLVAGAPIRLASRGVHDLKGVPGSWEVFAVVS